MSLINENFFLKLQQQGNKVGGQENQNSNQANKAGGSASIFGAQGAQGAAQQDKFSDTSIFNMKGDFGGFGGGSMGGDTLEIGNSTKNWASSMDVNNDSKAGTANNDKAETKETDKSDKAEKEDKTKEADNKDKKAEKSEKEKEKNAAIANGMFQSQEAEAGAEESGVDSIDLGIEDEAKDSAGDKFGNSVNGKDNKELLDAAKKIERATGKSIVENDKINITELENAVSGLEKNEIDEITGGKSNAIKQAGAM